MLKGWLDAGKCMLGFHQGDWSLQASNQCVLIQTCERCQAVSRRTEHMWSDWASEGEERCNLTRACTRCAESEERNEHEWDTWEYLSGGSCEQAQVCKRCRARADESRTQHDWQPWDYSERYRAPVRSCLRCALRASYFADQAIDQAEGISSSADDALAGVSELLSDDKAVADMIARAEQSADNSEANPEQPDSSGKQSDWQQQVALLRQLYQAQIEAGHIASERQPLLTSILLELENAVAMPTPSLADSQMKARRIQDLILRLRDTLLDPSRPQPLERLAAGSRAEVLAKQHENLHRYVITETSNTLLTGDEGKAVVHLMGRLRESREAIAALANGGNPVKLELESLRQLALDIRQFSLRHHLTLSRPVWPSGAVAPNPNAVFYSGGQQVRGLLERECESRRLQILIPQPHREPASLRWDQLRESAVAVFDLTGYKRTTILEEAAPVAGIAYELGIACALGRAVVIVANERQELPFDLDEEPIRLRNNDSDLTALGDGLDHALYGLLRGSAGTSVEKSLRHLRELFSSHPDFHVRLSLDTLDADAARDPIRARLLVGSTLGFLAAEAPHILHPVWPGDYPDPAARRCFHVTAFGPRWADETMTVVSDACRPNIEYVRGDKVLAPDILRSIWDEICRATHIVVDLTGLNANVAFELGVAHTLGRNLLLISQDAQPERYFRAIAKHRIHHYSLDVSPGVTGLKDTLRKFLA